MPSVLRRRDLLAGALAAGSAPAAAKPPNIVCILADDLGYGDLGCYNRDSKIPTPHLDRLASEGMRFTDAHSPSAVCTPTRYGLLTGRYAWRTSLKKGVFDGFDPPLIEPGRVTAASLLRSRGYTTACIGKWHLGMQWTRRDGTPMPFRTAGGFRSGFEVDYTRPAQGGPNAVGFDRYFGISASLDMPPYCFIENGRAVGAPGEKADEDKSLFMNQPPGARTPGFRLEHVMPALVREARSFIADHKGGSKPFFLYMPLSSPHLPIVPNEGFKGRSKAGLYGDFVVEMDASVGSVLDALKSSGAAENTLVIFTSDNGGLWHWWDFQEPDDAAHGKITPRGQYVKDFGHQSNAWMRGTKADIWEGGHRVPFLARWPGKARPGSVCDSPVCHVDLLATWAEASGAKLDRDAGPDSFSLMPALADPKARPRDHLIVHSIQGEFSIRQGNWKLIPSRGSNGFSVPRTVAGEPVGQLHDLANDRQETRNRYAEQPEVVARLGTLLDKYRKQERTRP